MFPSRAANAILAIVVGLLVGGGALVAPNPSQAPSPAIAAGATKTIVRSATLQTTDHNMWGPGNTAPVDQSLDLFNASWDESDDVGDVEEVCVDFGELGEVCTYFGAEIGGSVSGEIGMSINIEGLDGGKITVIYPVTITFTAPADNSFDPGDTVDIKTSMVVDTANARIETTFPRLDRVGWNGVFAFGASASARLCIFDCFGGEIFDFDIPKAEGEIFGFDPGALAVGCFDNPIINFVLGISTYPGDETCPSLVPGFGGGYLFNPNPVVTSTFQPDGSIDAAGEDRFVLIPISAMTWLTRFLGAPAWLQLNAGPFEIGDFSIGWTSFNTIISAFETMKQDFSFSGRVDVNLNWGKSLNYKVLDGTTDAELSSGNSTNTTLKVGDTLRLTTNSLNNKVIPISPTLMMANPEMLNHTRSNTGGSVELRALSFTFDGETYGPIYSELFPIGDADHTIFNDTFTMTGFNSPILAPFNIVPRPIVELRKDVVPANAPGTFNLRVDSLVRAPNVRDEGTTGRLVLEPGTRVLSETEGPDTNLNFFDITIVCREYDGGRIHTQSTGASPGLGRSMNLVLTGGEDLICTIKNRLPAPSECDSMTFDRVILGTPNSNRNDNLRGTNGRDIIIGYGGNDIITSHLGNDCLSGNAGKDRLISGEGNDINDGGPGDDTIMAGPGDDILEGGEGKDQLFAHYGNDILRGGPGDDTLAGDWDNDNLDGGPGNDSADGGGYDNFDFDVCIAEVKIKCEG
ncbi:MAG: calcium-binding protein [Dehalococcoidia bacterium]